MQPLLSAVDVEFGRELAQAHFIDTCRITRDGDGPRVLDETTGEYVDPPRVVVYEGPCRVQVRSDINSNAVEAVIGEHEFTYRTGTLQLPIEGTADIKPDYVAEHVSCPFDPSLEGRVYNMQAETKGKTHATHRRYRIREVLS